ncbi:serine hydrolase domain-containing protein [Phenylobacterium sp.]|uniref:serine hydrolase domain-containing protein n=1 Tax=Phenylobacterium sp. TaxID=1871053 RepID=UPI0025DDD6F9|nr:serine hydrolase domain-containing protein [Phenylobacterium sp.]
MMGRRDVLGGLGATAAAPSALTGKASPLFARVAALCDRLVAQKRLPGAAVQVSLGGEVALQHVAGWADVESGRPLAEDSLYRLFSMTKPVVAVALMMLYEDGRLLLTDPVADYVPEFANLRVHVAGQGAELETAPAQPMRLIHLLTHTSGLTNSWNGTPMSPLYSQAGLAAASWARDPGIEGLADYCARLGRIPLEFQPGSRWLYSIGPDVLGLVVERVSGQRFGDFLHERLFAPLGMADTGFFVRPDSAARLTTLYGRGASGLVALETGARSPYLAAPIADSGASGLVSSLPDYGRFARMLAGGGRAEGVRILSPAGARLMMSDQVAPEIAAPGLARHAAFGLGGVGSGMGFGLLGAVVTDVGRSHEEGVVGEYSWGGAASTTFWAAPSRDLAVVFMTQLSPSGTYPLRDWLKAAVYSELD